MRKERLLPLFLFLICLPVAQSQTIKGTEQPVDFTGSYAPIVPPGTPATNFNTPLGQNTFLLAIADPGIAVKIYVTNNTANACVGAFQLSVFAASDTTTTSFNGSISNWGLVPLLGTTGYIPTVAFDVPASQSIYLTTTAVTAPR